MSPFELTIRKGDKINLENQAFQTEWSSVYLCVVRHLYGQIVQNFYHGL
jgi:hypothetical protein